MASGSSPYTIRWGILATGGIASMFTKDLLKDPASRGVHDVAHEVVAAASSSSKERAQKFLEECGCPSSAKAYGSYEELVKDPNIDIIYVATPHSHHYQNTRLCLEAGKNVLCEKAFTVNAAQAKILVDIAREKNLFLMEAVWTRYFPLSVELRKMVKEGKLGTVHRVFADLSFGQDLETLYADGKHRMVNMDLAGGAMLDIGIYSITWVMQFLYHLQDPKTRQKPKVTSSMTIYPKTGADENTSMIFTFPPHNAQGIATSTLRVAWDPDEKASAGAPIRIQGKLGEIQVAGPPYRPESYKIIPSKSPDTPFKEVQVVEHKIPGQGMFWEADECARCLRDGLKESPGLSWEESITIMELMDEVRQQNGLVYPEKIESTEYPLPGF